MQASPNVAFEIPQPLSNTAITPVTSQSSDHTHTIRRLFLGPMPEKAVFPSNSISSGLVREAESSSSRLMDEIDHPNEISTHQAFRFFLMQGGCGEQWGAGAEANTRRQMVKKWEENEWTRNKADGKKKWVGNTFEIGKDILGMPDCEGYVLGPTASSSKSLGQPSLNSESPSSNNRPYESTSALLDAHGKGNFEPHRVQENAKPPSRTEGLTGGIRLALKKNMTTTSHQSKGKSPLLDAQEPRISSSPTVGVPPVEVEGLRGTVPPTDVLVRTGSGIRSTTASVVEQRSNREVKWGDIVLRDRMLVRISHIKTSNIPRYLDEKSVRSLSGMMHHEDWAEFIVVWRKDRLEIYEDYSVPGKEWFMGHKKLAFVVPLSKVKTRVSVYSNVDMTFCISCPPIPIHENTTRRRLFHRSLTGTNIFVFKNKSRTRAVDWIWNIWREIGGEIPETIDIKCPELDAKVTCPIPQDDDAGGYTTLTKTRIIELCQTQLTIVPGWDAIVEQHLKNGAKLELCWRNEMVLDWVWLEHDVEGNVRDWAVLFGLALKRPAAPTALELRLGEHLPTRVNLKDGVHLDEPASLEGYLYRIKPRTQIRTATYLTTHDGNIFTIPIPRAHPPPPPTALIGRNIKRDSEVKRGAAQILDSDGFIDLRNIMAVRRAFQPLPLVGAQTNRSGASASNIPTLNLDLDDDIPGPEEALQEGSDAEDEGGDEWASGVADKARLKMKRSFELVMKTGHVIRFEAFSRKIALDWINGLRKLIFYWSKRHRMDARQEMDLLHAVTGQKMTTRAHEGNTYPEGPPDPNKASPFLGRYWQWCVLDGCRSIVRAGRLFARFGIRGQFEHMFQVLASGHLSFFHLKPTGPGHHRHTRSINLLDAYITSSHLAVQALPLSEYEAPITPRRYQDGLIAEDAEEDITIVIWYRSHAIGNVGEGDDLAKVARDVPTLSGRNKMLVLKCRSKLEKDAWCWALNSEIEKLVRASMEREQMVRVAGGLIEVSFTPPRTDDFDM